MVAEQPLPALEPHTAPYWKAAREGRLVLQRCASCERVQFPPELSCTHCGAAECEWTEASGRARLYTWTLCHPPLLPYFAERAPWAVAAVELEEGPRMTTRIVGIEPDEYVMDMPLVADFEPVDEQRGLVVFRPAPA
jgi:uncharacterized OB-fold protein